MLTRLVPESEDLLHLVLLIVRDAAICQTSTTLVTDRPPTIFDTTCDSGSAKSQHMPSFSGCLIGGWENFSLLSAPTIPLERAQFTEYRGIVFVK